MGRREQSFHLMLVPRFLQSPRKMGPTPPSQLLSSLGLQPPAGICILSYIWFNLQLPGLQGRERAVIYANKRQADLCKNSIRPVSPDFLEAKIMAFPSPCHTG